MNGNKGGKMYTFLSKNELETKKIAKLLASKLKAGDIIILSRRFRLW